MAYATPAARREYYVKNREKELASSKKYRENNPEKIREYTEKLWFKKKEEEWENTLIELGYGDLYKS